MAKLSRIALTGAMALAISATGIISFADSLYKTPAEAVAGLTGDSVENVIAKRAETGKTYGTLANEAGKLEAFKVEMLEIKKASLDAQVKAGTMTQTQADAIMKALTENQATCDGTGTAKIGQNMGAKFGSQGKGQGNGGANRGSGLGQGQGFGRGLGVHNNQQ